MKGVDACLIVKFLQQKVLGILGVFCKGKHVEYCG